jgi:histone H3/H4
MSSAPNRLGNGKKHRKVLRDNIQGITKPSIHRLLHRAGVKTVSGLIYEEVRAVMKHCLAKFIRNILVYVQHDHRKTVYSRDVEAACESVGFYVAMGLPAKGLKKTQKEEKTCPEPKREKSAVAKGAKSHRFRAGTVALRNIRHFQKNSSCLAFPRLPFERLIREVAQDFSSVIRFSDQSLLMIQFVIEESLCNLFQSTLLVSIHAGRTTIYPKDLQLARRVANSKTICYRDA